jgi:eukaryotic-like serine/threonine-protein kinase
MVDSTAAVDVRERFSMERRLGEGASGAVFRAVDNTNGLTVAVKVLTRLDPQSLLRFKSEFRSLANISHPNLLQLYDLVSRDDEWLLSMELIEGGDFLGYVRPSPEEREGSAPLPQPEDELLGSFATVTIHGHDDPALQANQQTESMRPRPGRALGELDEARLRSALLQLCEGLHALHSKDRLHRDLKPANVLVSAAEDRVVICDFGLVVEETAQAAPAPRGPALPKIASGPGSVISTFGSTNAEIAGTLAFMSPEQALGRPLTSASDWYAVGVMIYQALTKVLPFDARRPMLEQIELRATQLPPHVHEREPNAAADLAELAMALLQIDPAARPGYAEVVARLRGEGAETTRTQEVSSALIGRDKQLAQLSTAFARARSGQATLAFVAGRSGMGKSALMRQFLKEIGTRDNTIVLSGRCYEREDLPYKAFDPLMDALSSALLAFDNAVVDELLPEGTHSLVRLFPVLKRVPAVVMLRPEASPPHDPVEQRRAAFAALREILRRFSLLRPLVLYIDDLQWGDLDSGPLFTELLHPPAAPAMLMVCAYRSEDERQSALLSALRATHLPEAGVTQPIQVDVDALEPEHTRALANALLAGVPGADAAAELITREAEGSPFFVGELSSYIRHTGRVAADQIRLDTVIEARLAALPDDSRQLLSVIAVAGRPERRAVIDAAAGLGPRSYVALRVLEAQHLAQSTGAGPSDRIEAYHDRIREAAYRALDEATRRALHERLATVLESKRDPDPEALLDHYRSAGHGKRAGEYAIKAAEKAEHALAFERAALLYREALSLLEPQGEEKRQLDERLGHVLVLAGHGVDAADAFFRALPGASPERAVELRRLATIELLRAGVVNRAFEELRRAKDILGMSAPVKTLEALLMLLWRRLKIRFKGLRLRKGPAGGPTPLMLQRMDMLWGIGGALSPVDQLRGNVYQAEHLLLAMQSGDRYRFARALAIESSVHATANRDPGATQRVIEQGLEMAGASGQPHALSAVKGLGGVSRMLEGRFHDGLRMMREAQVIIRENLQGTLAWDRNILVMFELRTLSMLGEVAELTARIPEFVRDAEARGDMYTTISARTAHCCWAWLGPDRPDAALEQVRIADKRWVRDGYSLQHWYTTQAIGEVGLYRSEVAEAAARVAREWKAMLVLRHKIQFTRAEMLFLRARLALAQAREQAHERTQLLEAVARDARALLKEPTPWIRAHGQLLRACAASFADAAAAAPLLAEAESRFIAADMKLMALISRWRRAQLTPGEAGTELRLIVESDLRALGVARPEGFARMLAPGFPSLPL